MPHLARRHLLSLGLAAFGSALGGRAFAGSGGAARRLSFENLHTGESVAVAYWSDGAYLAESVRRIDHVLRDHRTGDVHPIDPRLLDLLHRLRARLDTAAPFQIISGYRSPATNATLADASGGVARNSLHTRGLAVDIRVPGRPLRAVRDAALVLQGGGVGFYPRSDFVHVDVGRVRAW